MCKIIIIQYIIFGRRVLLKESEVMLGLFISAFDSTQTLIMIGGAQYGQPK